MQSKFTHFVAPLDQASTGRLVFLSAASGITLLAVARLPHLARGHFTRPVPCIEVKEGRLTLQYRRFPCFDRPVFLGEPRGEIRLNASLPWEIEFHGGISGLTAGLRGLQLRSLDILGRADQVTLQLSAPAGTGFIYISGGAHQISLRRPAETGVRLSALGGISNLSLDGRRFSAIAGEARLETSGFTSSTSRYEIGIAGGASHVTISQSE